MEFWKDGEKIGILPINSRTRIKDLKLSLSKWAEENNFIINNISVLFNDGTQLDPIVFGGNKWDLVDFKTHEAKIKGGKISIGTKNATTTPERTKLTGIKDLDLKILDLLGDLDALMLLRSHKNLYTDEIFHRVFGKRYYLLKYKKPNESYKKFYLRMLKFIHLLGKKFSLIYEYKSGDPELQYELLNNFSRHKKKLFSAAAKRGSLELVKYSFRSVTGTVADRNRIIYALMEASKNGYLEIVKFLVENTNPALFGTPLWYDLSDGDQTPLLLASEAGHADIVKYLLEKGAKVDFHYNKPLKIASLNGHLETVKALIEGGADIHVDDDLPLMWASREGHLPVVKYLVERGGNIGAGNNLALMLASERGHLPVVQYLVETGANFRAGNDAVLRRAKENKQWQVIAYLNSLYE